MRDRFQLGLMMFLQYAIWGSWAPVLSAYLLGDLSFGGTQVGFIYSLLPLATIIAPFVGGQIADRYFASEHTVAALQLSGGAVLLYAATLTDYRSLALVMFVYCLLYAPTLALTNSIAMSNLEDSEEGFGKVRVWGTVGWIAAGWALAAWRASAGIGTPAMGGDMFVLAGGFSILMGLQSFFLPHTPPRRDSRKPWAFLEALRMLRDRDFAIFMTISFVVATELQFYYVLTAPYLQSAAIGISPARVPAVMTIAQIAEILVLAVMLSWFLKRYGMRSTLALGVIAWPIRYVVFAIGSPWWLVVASLTLHGFCFVFFFVAAFIYVDSVAPKDIRASAQSLIAIVTLGVGSFVGSIFAGYIQSRLTVDGVTDWFTVFLVPCAITVLCALAYLLFFKDQRVAEARAT
ncbi:MAG TPA: MFS transporter [Acidobacteriota bacterium]|nr:MFS transporter [Acidobacteriota bacterium]